MDYTAVRTTKRRIEGQLWAARMAEIRARKAMDRNLRGETRKDGKPFSEQGLRLAAIRLRIRAAEFGDALMKEGWK